jgi:hypothetical protein
VNLVRNLCEWKTYEREKGTSNRQPIERLPTAVSQRHNSPDIRLHSSCGCSNRWLSPHPHSSSRGSQCQAPRICGARPVIDCDQRAVRRALLNPAGVMSAHSRAFFRVRFRDLSIVRHGYCGPSTRRAAEGKTSAGSAPLVAGLQIRLKAIDPGPSMLREPEVCDSLPVAMVVRAVRRMPC